MNYCTFSKCFQRAVCVILSQGQERNKVKDEKRAERVRIKRD